MHLQNQRKKTPVYGMSSSFFIAVSDIRKKRESGVHTL